MTHSLCFFWRRARLDTHNLFTCSSLVLLPWALLSAGCIMLVSSSSVASRAPLGGRAVSVSRDETGIRAIGPKKFVDSLSLLVLRSLSFCLIEPRPAGGTCLDAFGGLSYREGRPKGVLTRGRACLARALACPCRPCGGGASSQDGVALLFCARLEHCSTRVGRREPATPRLRHLRRRRVGDVKQGMMFRLLG